MTACGYHFNNTNNTLAWVIPEPQVAFWRLHHFPLLTFFLIFDFFWAAAYFVTVWPSAMICRDSCPCGENRLTFFKSQIRLWDNPVEVRLSWRKFADSHSVFTILKWLLNEGIHSPALVLNFNSMDGLVCMSVTLNPESLLTSHCYLFVWGRGGYVHI